MAPAPRVVLVVEDEALVRGLLVRFLESERYTVHAVDNGAQALEWAHRHRPDAVVLDLIMPVMDGWGFLRTCQQIPALSEVPVIVLTAAPDVRKAKLLELGVVACLDKPFDLDDLATTLAAACAWQPSSSESQCTYCGVDRWTYSLRVFDCRSPQTAWQLCDRCWTFLELGSRIARGGQCLAEYLDRPFRLHAVQVRAFISAGLRVMQRGSVV